MISPNFIEGSIAPPALAEVAPDLIFWRLLESLAYHVYQRAFMDGTGLPLVLESQRKGEALEQKEHQSGFCRLVNEGSPFSCTRCQMSSMWPLDQSAKGTIRGRCTAGLTYLMAPVRLGKKTVAYLVTGQFLQCVPTAAEVSAHAAVWLRQKPRLAGQLESLVPAFRRTQVLDSATIDRAEFLLNVFAELLGGAINSALIEHQPGESETIATARSLVRSRPGEEISSREAAWKTGLSLASFERRFQEETGICFKDFVTRSRLECARQCMMRSPCMDWREAAALGGCASNAEFSELFFSAFGETPRQYRVRMLANRQLLADAGRKTDPSEWWSGKLHGLAALTFRKNKSAAAPDEEPNLPEGPEIPQPHDPGLPTPEGPEIPPIHEVGIPPLPSGPDIIPMPTRPEVLQFWR